MAQRILFIGLPGSGKTTQAQKLAAEFDLCLIRTGDILRNLITKTGDLDLKKVLESGGLVSDEIIAKIIKGEFENLNCPNGLIVDGYPRTVKQLSYFDPQFDLVIDLTISLKEAENRLSKRGRFDDKPEIVENRFKVQKQELVDLIEYFNKNNTPVVIINGDLPINAVYDQLRAMVKE